MDAKTEGNQTRMVGRRPGPGRAEAQGGRLPAVLGYTEKDGVRRGVRTDIAVPKAAEKKPA